MTRFLDDERDDDERPIPARRGTRTKKYRWVKSLVAVVVSLAIIVGAGVVTYSLALSKAIDIGTVKDYVGTGETSVDVTIPAGAPLTQIGEILVDADVVASVKAFKKAIEDEPRASSIQPGTYRLKTKLPAAVAIEMLLDRDNMLVEQILIREGLRNSQLVTLLSDELGFPADDIADQLGSVSGLPVWAGGKSEGLLFPNTYEYDPDKPLSEFLAKMPAQFTEAAQEINFEAKAKALGIDPYDALIVASIIEKETRDPSYGPDIAQVIYNRLDKDMGLQLDSTVIYANNSPGTITTTDEERANPSPYNTYVHKGLPPGPISNPGRAAMQAAVNPSGADYMYFVAVNPDTGETKFATDKEGHDANVKEFQQWCRDNAGKCG